MSTPFSQAPLWYVSRSTGLVSFLLLTLTLALGVASTQRALASPRWPRFATQAVHRNVSLLGVVMLAVHVSVTIIDSYVDMSWPAAFVPLASSYQRFPTALGTLASDTLLLLVASSLLRLRIPPRVWRGIHWAGYGVWPVALLHYLLAGTDTGSTLGLAVAGVGTAAVLGAVAVRVLTSQEPAPVRSLL